MARIIETNIASQTIAQFYPFWKIFFISVFMGIVYWWLTGIVSALVISPMYCGTTSGAWVCSDIVGVSGNIATILVATISILIMLYLRMHQPLIIAVASGLLLWGLSRWTDGLLVIEIIFWDIALYVLSYILFSWVTRYSRALPVIVTVVIVIITVKAWLLI
jgi:hypothetical protein